MNLIKEGVISLQHRKKIKIGKLEGPHAIAGETWAEDA